MVARRTAVLAGGAALAAVAVAAGVTLAVTGDDDREDGVGAIRLENVSGSEVGSGQASGSGQVAGLDELTGTIERDADGDLVLNGVELDFGPDEWLATAGEVVDLDGDGTTARLQDEIDALVGTDRTVLVRLDDDGDDGDVYVVDDVTYRDTAGGPAPWQEAADGGTTGPAATAEEVSATAVDEIGEGARATDVDPVTDVAGVAWEVEVVDADGKEHTVLLDAAGEVLSAELDD